MAAGSDAGVSATGRTGADVVAEALADIGCTHAFGMPGGEVLALLDALTRAGIAFHLAKHENAAGFMAEGVWHAQAREGRAGEAPPGILLATLGPGVANAVNVIANAWQDRVPLIVLTGSVNDDVAATYTHQVFDHLALLRPVTKAVFRASAGAVAVTMEKAIQAAMEGQPGPVLVDVPIGVAEGACDEAVRPQQPPCPVISYHSLDVELTKAMANAERPLVIAGVDALNASGAVMSLCSGMKMPLITTYKAKGLVGSSGEDSLVALGLPPLVDAIRLGGHGLSPKSDRIILPLVKSADLVVLVGYDPIEMRIGWREPFADDAMVIEFTPVIRDHGMHRTDVTVLGDIERNLIDMLNLWDLEKEGDRSLKLRPSWPDGEPASAYEALTTAFAPPPGWNAHRVFATLREIAPDETVVTADSGAHRILLSQMWESAITRAMLQSTALCTMGCAVPLAMGHALAEPDRPVIAFVGDAGLEMGLGELATLRDMGLPVIICVLVDGALALIEKKQRATQRGQVGVTFGMTDFPAVANAMGGHGVWIDDEATLRAEAQAALTRDGFTLLACRIGERPYEGAF